MTVDGRPDPTVVNRLPFVTSGEFGTDLIALFRPLGAVEFKFRKRQLVGPREALLFELHLPREKNVVFTIRDRSGTVLRPEYQGSVLLDEASGQLLRLELQPSHLPDYFQITSAHTQTDFAMTELGDAGTFLLPVSSETAACVRYSEQIGRTIPQTVECGKNVLEFHGCRKFGAKAKIVGQPQ